MVGYNAFQTTENIVSFLRLTDIGLRSVEGLDLQQAHFINIPDLQFAVDLFTLCAYNQEHQQEIVDKFLEGIKKGKNKWEILKELKDELLKV